MFYAKTSDWNDQCDETLCRFAAKAQELYDRNNSVLQIANCYLQDLEETFRDYQETI